MAWLFKRSIGQMDRTIEGHKEALKEHDAALKQHDRQHSACTLELANFKTEVAKDYAKDATVQQSLGRIHERIDDLGKVMQDGFKDMGDDIKTLIGKVGSK